MVKIQIKYGFTSFICIFVLKYAFMETLDNIKKPISREFEEFAALFKESVSSDDGLLGQVLEYVGARHGKMLRPILMLLSGRLCGRVGEKTYHSAIALELLHTASLVHDDVVDESDRRRGSRSVNDIFDNKVAVLGGDYILGTSLLHASFSGDIEVVRLIARLGQALSHGEIVQLESISSDEFSEEKYYKIIRNKTAVLFSSSSAIGAICAGSDRQIIDRMFAFGEKIGMAFQIKDDIFDYYSNDIGKPTGNDMREGKLTLPSLYVLNNGAGEEQRATALKIRRQEATDEEIHKFVEYVKSAGGIEYAEERMKEIRAEAMDMLPSDASPELVRALRAYIDFVVERKI